MTPEQAKLVEQAERLLEAWEGLDSVLLRWGKQCEDLAEALFSGYHEDDFVRGMMVGEGYAWDRAGRAFSHAHAAMRLAQEAADKGARDE